MAATLKDIKKLLDSHKVDIVTQINSKIDSLIADVDLIRETANKADTQATANANEIQLLKSEISALHVANKALETLLEDQVNRGMRSTLIFKGIKEEENETWEQSEHLLIDVINRHMKTEPKTTVNMIERAHRGRASANPTGPRHIYAKFHSWKDSERIKTEFGNIVKQHPKIGIRVEQMFSEKLTKRRNVALVKRKELLEGKAIVSGYLKYPAVLMVKKSKSDKKYTSFKAF